MMYNDCIWVIITHRHTHMHACMHMCAKVFFKTYTGLLWTSPLLNAL